MARIITTIGPSSIERNILIRLKSAGAKSYRINLSHSNKESLAHYFDVIASAGLMPSIDTQGAQLRVEGVNSKKDFCKGDKISIFFGASPTKISDFENSDYIRLNHPEVSDQASPGDIMKIDFGGLAIRLDSQIGTHQWLGTVTASGSVMPNRAVDISGKNLKMAILTEFDKYAIDFAQRRGCREIFASFVSSKSDALAVRDFAGDDTKIISKIETSLGVYNAKEIAINSDEVLIDRGDLSREIGISSVPIAVSSILRLCRKLEKPVNIATNLLDSMMHAKTPSRAEISDIFTLLELGASGLVLAAEVAIGENPVSSTALVNHMINLYDRHESGLYGIGSAPKPDVELIGAELINWL